MEDSKKIFISHSAADSNIGEKFLEFLISLGYEKNNIFFSSRYHTGVELGKNFSNVVKENFKQSNIIIYLLTKNFYDSAYCNNEIGAGWICDDKEIVPILIGNMTFGDMRGFIGSQTKSFSTKSSERDELFTFFSKRTENKYDIYKAKDKYDDFLNCSVGIIQENVVLNYKETQIIKGLQESNNGMIPYITALNAVTITINGKNICDGLDLADRLEYKEAVENLIKLGYIKKMNLFISLTGKGARLNINK